MTRFCKSPDGKFKGVFERDGVLDIEFAGNDAAQGGEVGAGAEFLAQLVGQGADVGALGAGDAEPGPAAPHSW